MIGGFPSQRTSDAASLIVNLNKLLNQDSEMGGVKCLHTHLRSL